MKKENKKAAEREKRKLNNNPLFLGKQSKFCEHSSRKKEK